jgi:hypothetical protein
VPGFEDEDDDEDENEAPCEGGSLFYRNLGLKPQAKSYSPRPHRYAKRCGPGLRDKDLSPVHKIEATAGCSNGWDSGDR